MRTNHWTEAIDEEIIRTRQYLMAAIESYIRLNDPNNADYFIEALGTFETRFGDTTDDDTDHDTYLRLKAEAEDSDDN